LNKLSGECEKITSISHETGNGFRTETGSKQNRGMEQKPEKRSINATEQNERGAANPERPLKAQFRNDEGKIKLDHKEPASQQRTEKYVRLLKINLRQAIGLADQVPFRVKRAIFFSFVQWGKALE
jgi:hypothetical protein